MDDLVLYSVKQHTIPEIANGLAAYHIQRRDAEHDTKGAAVNDHAVDLAEVKRGRQVIYLIAQITLQTGKLNITVSVYVVGRDGVCVRGEHHEQIWPIRDVEVL